eukprot:TRINITY_DN9276_c0_g1_i2.p1 TRINITY_DN9276_c0_g1~~TRINITY_DN9276_c0_g1_i2.p1  ORF type:complete len:391 (-),score=-21.03 TRINITY_DN9276_c0_g1_i2:58-1230(-)
MSIPPVKRLKLFGVRVEIPLSIPIKSQESEPADTTPLQDTVLCVDSECAKTPDAGIATPSVDSVSASSSAETVFGSSSTESVPASPPAELVSASPSIESVSSLTSVPEIGNAEGLPKVPSKLTVKTGSKSGASKPRLIKLNTRTPLSPRPSFVDEPANVTALREKLDSPLSSKQASKKPITARISRPEAPPAPTAVPLTSRLSRPESEASAVPISARLSRPEPARPKCRYYLTKSGCRFGSKCRNLHVDRNAPLPRRPKPPPDRIVEAVPSRKRRERDVEAPEPAYASYSQEEYPDSDGCGSRRSASPDDRIDYRDRPWSYYADRDVPADEPSAARGGDYGHSADPSESSYAASSVSIAYRMPYYGDYPTQLSDDLYERRSPASWEYDRY